MMRSVSSNGRPRMSTAFTSVNTVVFAPMPKAKVMAATAVNQRSLTSMRTAKRRSGRRFMDALLLRRFGPEGSQLLSESAFPEHGRHHAAPFVIGPDAARRVEQRLPGGRVDGLAGDDLEQDARMLEVRADRRRGPDDA